MHSDLTFGVGCSQSAGEHEKPGLADVVIGAVNVSADSFQASHADSDDVPAWRDELKCMMSAVEGSREISCQGGVPCRGRKLGDMLWVVVADIVYEKVDATCSGGDVREDTGDFRFDTHVHR